MLTTDEPDKPQTTGVESPFLEAIGELTEQLCEICKSIGKSAPSVKVEAPSVNVQPAQVNVPKATPVAWVFEVVERDAKGQIKKMTVTPKI